MYRLFFNHRDKEFNNFVDEYLYKSVSEQRSKLKKDLGELWDEGLWDIIQCAIGPQEKRYNDVSEMEQALVELKNRLV